MRIDFRQFFVVIALIAVIGFTWDVSKTVNAQTTPFAISNVKVSAVTQTGFQVDWDTSGGTHAGVSGSQVGYGLTNTSYIWTPCCSPGGVTHHTVVIANGAPASSTAPGGKLIVNSGTTYVGLADSYDGTVEATSPFTVTTTPNGITPPPTNTNTTAVLSCTPHFQTVQMATFVPSGATGLTFEVSNQGTSVLTIAGVVSSSTAFVLASPTVPVSIPIGATQNFTVKFIPTAAGKYTGSLTFMGNVQGGSFGMGVTGVAQ
jgi:hypothetical protein